MRFSVGFGKDIHNLKKNKNKPLVLGGYFIKKSKYSIVAHSDGDLILHAIASALLGAINFNKTIGELFPDTDINNKNLNSKLIIDQALKFTKNKGFLINNIDITIVCQKIMLKDHLVEIKNSLIKILNCSNLAIKCTRFENKFNNQIECNVILSLISK